MSSVLAQQDRLVEIHPEHAVSRIAFGSCLRNPAGAEILDKVVAYKPGRTVQVILLDGRWHLDKAREQAADSYLGKAQWAWLEEVLKRPAELRVICSGVQVVKLNANGRQWEMWGHHTSERKRLFDLIESTGAKGVVFISGDMHFAEIHKTTDTAYPLHDITASGLDQIHAHDGKARPGPEQVGRSLVRSTNFGGLVMDWEKSTLRFELLNGEGELFLSHPVALGELQPQDKD